ncbi:hypothetical protein Tel_13385 [Candidatus Tenderia electrophaga]|jgi:hypothetical protein|uniref:DUF3330 domain-containing protein n=1 Tax=Candidatus Tenderia electrophaga TaxID=1748243 RepID=A0A0S2TFV2_9GAMM|nr:hypothetical protein Tel_13385 [Candidatus Tenderia electrophaga]
MNDSLKSKQDSVKCEVCMKEVPLSEAKSAEANEYVAHFCGLDCYAKWRHQAGTAEDAKKTSG